MKSIEEIKNSFKILELSLMDANFDEQIEAFGHAVSSPIRLKMFRQICQKPMTLVEIAKLNEITNSTAIFHLKLLQDAGLIVARYLPGKKGKAQVFFVQFSGIYFSQDAILPQHNFIFEQSVGIGDYIEADLKSLSIATKDKRINLGNEKAFSSLRHNAKLLWTDGGKLTYGFDNSFAQDSIVQEISISFEVCSEARFYRNDWKSDLTFYINGIEVASYTSPGDFGGVRGKLNPDWWGDENTQYGILVNLSVTDEGTFINSQKVSDVNLKNIHLAKNNKLTFTIYTKPDAEFYGGFNLFGDCFGNYPQDIILTAKCVKK